MPVMYVAGDPLLTGAQTLAFGHNAKGRIELGALETRLMHAYPAAFASYGKQCRGGRIKPGELWLWRESQPQLAFLTVRETAVGATRARFVESVIMTLARDYRLYGLVSLAITPMGEAQDWLLFRRLVDYWLNPSPLRVFVYEQVIAGQQAAEELVDG